MASRLLMVCTGNICRSAMAAIVLAQHAEQQGCPLQVDSAGVSNEEAGNSIDRRAAQVLSAAGYRVPRHVARQITTDDLKTYDLILAMTSQHYREVERLAKKSRYQLADNQLRMYRSFELETGTRISGQQHLDVPDPWYGNTKDFLETLKTIERVTPHLLAYTNAVDAAQ